MGKDKKNKKYKIDADERRMVDAFRSCVETEAATGRYACYVNFEEVHNDEGYQLNAILDYGKFKARLFYNPSYFLTDMLDVKFDLESQFLYSIYDIFNLFDISDFEQYYYSDIQFEENLKKDVHSILEMINKYSYDIEKASDPANLITLNSNVENDYKRVYSKDKEESWREGIHNPFDLDINHPYFSEVSSATDSVKLLKKLKKLHAKDKLTTLYEKRLLNYLEQGNRVVNESVAEDKKLDNSYSKLVIFIDLAITAVIAIIVGLIMGYGKYVGFEGAYIPKQYFEIGNLSIPYDIFIYLIAVIVISFGFASLLIKPIYKRITKSDEAMMQKFVKAQKDNGDDKLLNKIIKVVAAIAAIIIGFSIAIVSSMSNIGFYDDYIKFNDDASSEIVEISNKDVQFIKVLGEYDEDDEYVAYEDSCTYIVTDSVNHYYELYSIEPNGETEKRIKNIISAYGKEVKEIKTRDVFIDTLEQTE